MSKIIEFESQHGIIRIESNEENKRGSTQFSTSKKLTEKAKERFEQSIDVLQNVSNAVIDKLNGVAKELEPDEIEIKVGLKFTAEAGAIIAKTSAEGNLEVTIKWKNEKTLVTDEKNRP